MLQCVVQATLGTEPVRLWPAVGIEHVAAINTLAGRQSGRVDSLARQAAHAFILSLVH